MAIPLLRDCASPRGLSGRFHKREEDDPLTSKTSAVDLLSARPARRGEQQHAPDAFTKTVITSSNKAESVM
ncbi:MAG: hypothetical protein DMF03_07125 [Verrucomicrobia bacterium]|nr:MAG: hypothetical protein DMF03_07125 [Verrucomicrobiota bacterium]